MSMTKSLSKTTATTKVTAKTAKPVADTGLLTKGELIKTLKISATMLGNYIREGMPTAYHGRGGEQSLYNLDDVYDWLDERNDPGSTKEKLAAQRLKKLEIDTARAELELQIERGQVIEIQKAVQVLSEVLTRVRGQLVALPAKAAGEVIGIPKQIEVQLILESFINETLQELVLDLSAITKAQVADPENADPENADPETKDDNEDDNEK